MKSRTPVLHKERVSVYTTRTKSVVPSIIVGRRRHLPTVASLGRQYSCVSYAGSDAVVYFRWSSHARINNNNNNTTLYTYLHNIILLFRASCERANGEARVSQFRPATTRLSCCTPAAAGPFVTHENAMRKHYVIQFPIVRPPESR